MVLQGAPSGVVEVPKCWLYDWVVGRSFAGERSRLSVSADMMVASQITSLTVGQFDRENWGEVNAVVPVAGKFDPRDHRTRLRVPRNATRISTSAPRTIIRKHEMSRPSTSSARPLSLTEELEKLEQSITLTLQGTLESNSSYDVAHQIRRNRPQFQSRTPDCNIKHPTNCRTICGSF